MLISIRRLQRIRALALATTALQLLPFAAQAANNAVIVTPGSGVTMRSDDVGAGVQSMLTILGDTSGNPLASAPGTGNSSFALPVQGVVGGVALPVSVTGGTITAGTVAISGGTLNAVTSIVNALPGGTNTLGFVNTVLAGGTATLGAISSIVNQITANVAQFGGSNVVTGPGLSGNGVPRVTVSSDSTIAGLSVTVSTINTLNTIVNPLPGGTNTLGTVNATVLNVNANGQATMGASSPVVIASDQSAVAVKLNSTPSLANGNGVVIAQGGSVLAATNPIFDAITDGTHGPAAVKAASATAVAADAAVVMQLNPNSPGIVALGPNSAANAVPVIQSVSSSTLVALTKATTTTLAPSLMAVVGAHNLYGYNCTGITGGSAGFCVAYNGTVAPGAGSLISSNVLDFCYFDTTARGCALSYIPLATNYSLGIAILVTTSASPYTYVASVATAAMSVVYQ